LLAEKRADISKVLHLATLVLRQRAFRATSPNLDSRLHYKAHADLNESRSAEEHRVAPPRMPIPSGG